jgi:NAD(P) transhydrogenase subunit beta
MTGLIVAVVDLAAAFLFIYGLKRMSSPVTAPSGIRLAGAGMLVAIAASFLYVFEVRGEAESHLAANVLLAVIALGLGLVGAWRTGSRVPMTAMPQMVAIYNGMGGGAAAAIAASQLFRAATGGTEAAVAMLGGLIGSVSLAGSIVAWAKLDERLQTPWRIKRQQALNAAAFVGAVALGLHAAMLVPPGGPLFIGLFFLSALAVGVLMTLPIGGADMPVVISMYNAFTGLAVGLEGFVLQNPSLMIAGMVVGSAGTLLTLLMAKAMNRSVGNVLFANFGATVVTAHGEVAGSLKPIEASDAGIALRYARSVVIVPGYGLAVAQAQHKLYELVKLLQAADVGVKFAVHPVAGRMPGHMDVLLAEAGVPYDLIYELEDVNDEFTETDVALVIGANDVVNPAARSDKSSPIYGMPILNVDHARQVYVIKRGQGKGYSGIENELFYAPNCDMVYGDAQAVLVKMIQAVKELGLESKVAA